MTNGCATSRARLADVSTSVEVTKNATNITTRTITTDLKGSAWFTSAQTIAKLKALQTDKTQSIGGEAFKQQGGTNAVEALKYLDSILGKLAP